MGKPTVLTYHSDLKLPPGPFNWLVNQVVRVMNRLAGLFSDRVVAYTRDFAGHSPFLRHFHSKIEVVAPPVELPEVGPGAVATAMNKATMSDSDKRQKLQSTIPLSRMARPAEIANLVARLASGQANYVTATTYFIDGGIMQFSPGL